MISASEMMLHTCSKHNKLQIKWCENKEAISTSAQSFDWFYFILISFKKLIKPTKSA